MEAHGGLYSNENAIQSIVFIFTCHYTLVDNVKMEMQSSNFHFHFHIILWLFYVHNKMKMEKLFDI